MSLPLLLNQERKQPFSMKKALFEICPSRKRIVLAGISRRLKRWLNLFHSSDMGVAFLFTALSFRTAVTFLCFNSLNLKFKIRILKQFILHTYPPACRKACLQVQIVYHSAGFSTNSSAASSKLPLLPISLLSRYSNVPYWSNPSIAIRSPNFVHR